MNGVIDWLRDPANWSGPDGVPTRLAEHGLLDPGRHRHRPGDRTARLALWLGHIRRGGSVAINISNIGRAIPILALLSLLSLGFVGTAVFGPFGRAGLATLITLALFALPPIITNTYTGIVEVDQDTVEAARGMGLSERQLLRRVEVPLAMPLIMSGIRLAVVQVWATATIAALVAGPGLGRIITHGYDAQDGSEVIAGAIIVAAIALALEAGLGLVVVR